jgi:hypothetical protein
MQDSDSSPTQVTRADLVRAGNDRVVAAAERHRFDAGSPVPVLCECDDDDCREFVRATVAQVREAHEGGWAVVAPGHGRREALHEVATRGG